MVAADFQQICLSFLIYINNVADFYLFTNEAINIHIGYNNNQISLYTHSWYIRSSLFLFYVNSLSKARAAKNSWIFFRNFILSYFVAKKNKTLDQNAAKSFQGSSQILCSSDFLQLRFSLFHFRKVFCII